MRKTFVIITGILIVLIFGSVFFLWNQKRQNQNIQPENWIISTRTLTDRESKRLDSGIKSLYEEEVDVDYYFAESEIIYPTFKQVFPETQLYIIQIYIPLVHDSPVGDTPNNIQGHKMMARFRRKYYRMPLDFNQLMFDAGYELNAENQDLLAHALIIGALPAEMVGKSVLCNPSYKIDEDFGARINYTRAIDCQVGDDKIFVLFRELNQQFNGGLILWGELGEHGYPETGKDFSVYPINR